MTEKDGVAPLTRMGEAVPEKKYHGSHTKYRSSKYLHATGDSSKRGGCHKQSMPCKRRNREAHSRIEGTLNNRVSWPYSIIIPQVATSFATGLFSKGLPTVSGQLWKRQILPMRLRVAAPGVTGRTRDNIGKKTINFVGLWGE